MDLPPTVGQKIKKNMRKVPQAMSVLDAYEILLQCEFTERSYRKEYQCVPFI